MDLERAASAHGPPELRGRDASVNSGAAVAFYGPSRMAVARRRLDVARAPIPHHPYWCGPLRRSQRSGPRLGPCLSASAFTRHDAGGRRLRSGPARSAASVAGLRGLPETGPWGELSPRPGGGVTNASSLNRRRHRAFCAGFAWRSASEAGRLRMWPMGGWRGVARSPRRRATDRPTGRGPVPPKIARPAYARVPARTWPGPT